MREAGFPPVELCLWDNRCGETGSLLWNSAQGAVDTGKLCWEPFSPFWLSLLAPARLSAHEINSGFHFLVLTTPGSFQETRRVAAYLLLHFLCHNMDNLDRQAEAMSQEGPDVGKAAWCLSSVSPWGKQTQEAAGSAQGGRHSVSHGHPSPIGSLDPSSLKFIIFLG